MKQASAALVAALLISGCATITRGTEEAFAIETTPAGAIATVSNGMVCKTPCSVRVKRKGDIRVEIVKPGFETATATVTSSIDGGGSAGMAGNVLVGGLIGAGIDAGSGAMHSHTPNPLTVVLVPQDAVPSQDPPERQAPEPQIVAPHKPDPQEVESPENPELESTR